MVKIIIPRGKGRPDYSAHISKTAIPSLESKNNTQIGYWATSSLIISPNSQTTFTIEKGFSVKDEWVPKDTLFFIEAIEVFSNIDSLIKFQLLFEARNNPGVYTVIGQSYGWGQAVLFPKRCFMFRENTRPVYRIYNYNTSESIKVVINIYGFTEKV